MVPFGILQYLQGTHHGLTIVYFPEVSVYGRKLSILHFTISIINRTKACNIMSFFSACRFTIHS